MLTDSIFISYAKEDFKTASMVYDALKSKGFNPWLDNKKLRGGQDWDDIIQKEIRSSRYFILIISNNSVNKHGYCQKELRIALDAMNYFPTGEIFLIPARINECTINDQVISRLHYIDLFPDINAGIQDIISSLLEEEFVKTNNGEKIIDSLLHKNNKDLLLSDTLNKIKQYRSEGKINHYNYELYLELIDIINHQDINDASGNRRLSYIAGVLMSAGLLGDDTPNKSDSEQTPDDQLDLSCNKKNNSLKKDDQENHYLPSNDDVYDEDEGAHKISTIFQKQEHSENNSESLRQESEPALNQTPYSSKQHGPTSPKQRHSSEKSSVDQSTAPHNNSHQKPPKDNLQIQDSTSTPPNK